MQLWVPIYILMAWFSANYTKNNSWENYTKIWEGSYEYGNGPGHRGTAVLLPISETHFRHYDDVIMSAIASRINSLTTVYLIVYSRADQRKHQSSASLAFVRGIHRRPVNSPHKGPVTRKMVPFDHVIMGKVHHNPNRVKCASFLRENNV